MEVDDVEVVEEQEINSIKKRSHHRMEQNEPEFVDRQMEAARKAVVTKPHKPAVCVDEDCASKFDGNHVTEKISNHMAMCGGSADRNTLRWGCHTDASGWQYTRGAPHTIRGEMDTNMINMM